MIASSQGAPFLLNFDERSMAGLLREAKEAGCEHLIHAEGEMQAAKKLTEAARILSAEPQSILLRYMETLTAVAGDKSSTIVFPLPMDLLEPLLARKVRKEG